MHWLKCSESVKRDTNLLKRLYLTLVLEAHPEESTQIQKLRRVVEQQLLVPVRVLCVLSHYTHHSIELIRIGIVVQGPTEFTIARRWLSIWGVRYIQGTSQVNADTPLEIWLLRRHQVNLALRLFRPG
jgi:hypothetical protein